MFTYYLNGYVEIYREGSVMAFHGHQLWFDFDLAKIEYYEKKWSCEVSSSSLFWDIEEWVVGKLNKYFQLDKKQAYVQAFKTLSCLNKLGQLYPETDTVITGHTHLPFDVEINFRGKEYRVVNLGSALKGKPFNPVYIKSIDKLFISDLHLGTKKSLLE